MAQQQQGSGFTNIQNILSANQNNQLGNAVGSGVQGVAKEANQGLQTANQNFQNSTKQGLQTLQSDKTNEQSVLQNPTTATDQNVADFAKYRSGQYSGPTTLGDTTGLKNKAQEAEQLGQAGQSTGGRLGLLQRFVAGGNQQYNSGQQNLDNLLLGQNANSNLAQARRSTVGLGNKVNQAEQNAQNTGQTVQGQYQNFANQTNQDIHNQQNPVLQQLSTQAASEQAAKDARAAQIQQGLQSGTLSAADAQLLGLNSEQDIGNIDLNRFLTVDPTKANQQNVANSQQTAQLNALAKLGGQDAFSADPSQAGAFGQNQFKYDTSGLGQAIAQNNANFTSGSQLYQNLADQSQQSGQGILQNIAKNSTLAGNNPGYSGAAAQALQSFGIDPNDPNAFSKLASVYSQSQNNQYTGQGSGTGQIGQGGGNFGKDISEGIFGNQNGLLAGSSRDAIINALKQYNQNSQAVNQLKQQYGIGRKLGISDNANIGNPTQNITIPSS